MKKRDYYRIGLKGRPRPRSVERGSRADIEWQQGRYVFLNHGRDRGYTQ